MAVDADLLELLGENAALVHLFQTRGRFALDGFDLSSEIGLLVGEHRRADLVGVVEVEQLLTSQPQLSTCPGARRLRRSRPRAPSAGLLADCVVPATSSAEFETMWERDGQTIEFGARLTAPNKGPYGVNLWIDGTTYGPESRSRSANARRSTNGPPSETE